MKFASFILTILFGFYANLLVAQTDTIYRTTTKTSKHKHIPETKLFLALPEDDVEFMDHVPIVFFPLSNISVIDNSFANYFEATAFLTKNDLERRNIEYSEFIDVKINQYYGKLICMNGTPEDGSEILFVFGDSSTTVTVNVNYEYKNSAEQRKLKELLLSAWYDPNFSINYLESAPFTIETKETTFKFAKFTTNNYIFNESGEEKFDINSQPFLMVLNIPNTGTYSLEEFSAKIPDILSQFGFTPEKLTDDINLTINGVKAIESQYEFYAKGKKRKVYSCTILKGDFCILAMGVAFYDYENYMSTFKKIAATIKFR